MSRLSLSFDLVNKLPSLLIPALECPTLSEQYAGKGLKELSR